MSPPANHLIPTLLGPNATELERALERVATRRLQAISPDIDAVLDPWRCPAHLLPWLAWEESVDVWRADWDEATKRGAIAAAAEAHRRKGTMPAVRRALEGLGARAVIRDWFELPAQEPFTAEARIYATGPDGAPQLSPELAEDLTAAVDATARLAIEWELAFGVQFPPSLGLGVAGLNPVAVVRTARTMPDLAIPAGAPIGAAGLRPVAVAHAGGRVGREVDRARPAGARMGGLRPVAVAISGDWRAAA